MGPLGQNSVMLQQCTDANEMGHGDAACLRKGCCWCCRGAGVLEYGGAKRDSGGRHSSSKALLWFIQLSLREDEMGSSLMDSSTRESRHVYIYTSISRRICLYPSEKGHGRMWSPEEA